MKKLFSLIFIGTLFACSSDVNDSESNASQHENIDITLQESLKMNDGEAKVFFMPTPLQASTLIKNYNLEYNESLMLPFYEDRSRSKIKLAILAGYYSVDLGYSTIYNNYQKSINYFGNVKSIMEKLHGSESFDANYIKRFESNTNNQDSLCKIILESYNEAHSYFVDNEKIGALILTGCYLESTYIFSKHSDELTDKQIDQFITHNNFANNFILILSPYAKDKEVAKLIKDIEKLKLLLQQKKFHAIATLLEGKRKSIVEN